MLTKKLPAAVAALLLACGLLGAQTSAQTLRLTPGTPPAHPGHTPLFTAFAEQIDARTDGDLTGMILGTEVANLGNMRTAIRSGLSDAGMFLPAYFPADLSEINLVGNLSFLGSNAQAMAAAMTEYIVTCADCQAELKQLGVVYGSSHSSDIYVLLTTKPVRDLGDLQGLRLRVGGPHFARWAEEMGADGANVSVGETFEAISQGVLDGTIASTADLISFRLDDVVTHITVLPMGTYHSTISHAINARTWDGMSAEDRRVLAETSSYASALATQRWGYEMPSAAEAAARDAGIEFIEPSADLLEASNAYQREDLQKAIELAQDRDGIADAAAKVERFEALVDKWTDFAESVDNDPQRIADEVNRQVWDQVDFSTYGL
ncbi:C4-dicarboxylate ABC transporter substrate-binding protein [Saccharospirillum sp. MSK14-1]|uniref:C4-dicarboxylate TRAP transporter substrate-binding protein n=1 Tax=Saccharospirillum sp. MSK14-1 TaxID=1897632 RepID=UPI000D380CD6|nr:C4-dicarboxylate TRAP transporter substrate-binding protein [Saccharospirillum sp. MSK14-1]PTY37860.1 C4-dicarboxylate ABC transporter substrate-binding protein [Saccharospirillum sp. MSK14-1]